MSGPSRLDLRSFLATIREAAPREYLTVHENLSGHFQLAAFASALQQKLRVPVIEFACVDDSDWPVVQNVCASLPRIARSLGWKPDELERRLQHAYQHRVPPVVVKPDNAPVREVVLRNAEVDITRLPAMRYTESETHPYLSAAQVVARDPVSGALNISFHRLMVESRHTLAIYMTGGGHLEQIFRHNATAGQDTPVAVFIGAHPLWSLGALAAGSLSLDEFEVIGGLLDAPLAVVSGLQDDSLSIPAAAEIALEGTLLHDKTLPEGPYGEAFGFVSGVGERPVFRVDAMSHRTRPLFQDIVPGQLEHLTMTGTAVQVHLKKTLHEQFPRVRRVYLPAPMTVYLSVARDGDTPAALHDMIKTVLSEQRFVKHVVLFDDDVEISMAKQTHRALSLQVQADRDVVIIEGQRGNGLDPSERGELTTKWGVDATSIDKPSATAVVNRLPQHIVDQLDLGAILATATDGSGKVAG